MTGIKYVFDDIIVGGGLAGCLMAFELISNGRKVLLIDEGQAHSSSAVAAGIINPITGKKYIKSWNIDLFLPQAVKTYREIEKLLGITILYEKNIVRSLPDISAENQWESRKLDENYTNFIKENADISDFQNEVNISGNLAEIRQAYRIDILTFITSLCRYLEEKGGFLCHTFDVNLLKIEDKQIGYLHFSASNIIFCEGQKGISNPLFPDPGFALTRGEATIINIPESRISKMIKDEIFLVPFGNDLFWVGGGYENVSYPEKITSNHKKIVKKEISSLVKVPFETVEVKSAVRPTTKSRRPLVKQHEMYPHVYYFNGLGTKGSSIGPYIAHQLAKHILSENNTFEIAW
ncbi:MAG: FAD-binding oxidoreductase [Saprospiraceae bacterium]|nr:FAD-binding oxidoreductase [Saprospiraceae bacterium]